MPSRFLNNININDEYSFPSADGSADQIITTDGAGQLSFVDQSTINAGNAEHVVIYAKNTHTASIAKGTPVYITGTVGATDTVEIAPADASNSAKMPAVGILDATLAVNAFGYVITGGFMDNITTDPIDGATPSSNDTVYVKAGGGLTLTKPTGASNLIQNIAKVGKVSGGNAGSLIVSSILRTNDVPNLTTGKIWVGDGNTTESTVVHLDETNGRMGINTNSPQVPLEAKYTGTVDEIVRIVGTASGKPQMTFYNDTTLHTKIVAAGNNDFSITNTHSTGDMFFAAGGATRLHIDSNGDVGIGTTSPNATLDVNGAGNFSGGTVVSGIDSTQTGVAIPKGMYLKSNDGNYLRNIIGHTSGGIIEIGQTGTALISDIRLKPGSSGNIIFEGSGSEDMRINSSGNVGIGTSSPGAKLDVSGGDIRLSTNATYLRSKDSASAIPRVLGMNSANAFYVGPIDTYAGGPIVYGASSNLTYHGFYGGGSEKVRITSAGNVGIGTTNPVAKLDSISADGNTSSLRLGRSDNSNYWDFNHAGNDLRIFNTAGSGSDVLIGPNSGGTDQGNRLAIGTATPTQRLHVNGNARVTGAYYDSNNSAGTSGQVLSSTGTGTDWIDAASGGVDGSGSTNYVAKWSDSDTITNSILFDNGTNVGIGETNPAQKLHVIGNSEITGDIFLGRYIFHNDDTNTWLGFPSADTISFRTNGSDRMYINSSGNVGIGTTSPASNRKLHVAGNARVDSTFYLGTDSACAFFRYFNSLLITNSANTNISLGGGPGNVNNNVFVGNGYLDVNGTIRGKNYLYLEDAAGTLRTSFRVESTYATLDNGSNTLNYNAGNHYFLVGLSEKMRINSSGNVGIGTTSPGERLEVNGTVKATATTDAYKGYIKQTVISNTSEKVESTNYSFFPYNSSGLSTTAQYYNRMTAAYSGRIKKVYLRHAGGSTPTATAVNFKKHTNGVTASTVYSATVANTASTNMTAYYEFGNNDFTFNAGDLIGLLYQTTDAFGTASKTMGGVSATIIIEYNIT